MNFGNWELKRWDEIEDEAFIKWSKDIIHEKVPGGESYAECFHRVKNFWEELIIKDFDQVVLCTHPGVMKAILTHILEMPLKNSVSLKFRFGEIIRIEHNAKNYTFEFISNKSHW
jgi:alpha-ribazole phosphatase